jgi:hypothetical protein
MVAVVLLAVPSISVEVNARRQGSTTEPRPVARVDHVAFSESTFNNEARQRVCVFLVIALTNRGMPSTFDRYELTLKRGGAKYPMRACHVTDSLEMTGLRFEPKDDLRNKTYPNAVATGAASRGFLLFRVLDDSVTYDDWEAQGLVGTQVILSFKDCVEETHHLKYTFQGRGGKLPSLPGFTPATVSGATDTNTA